MKRNASARWQGTGKEGKGSLSTQSSVLNDTPYSFNTRFADGIGTNPEELIAAAHAGCFAMKLSFVLNEAGFTANSLDAKCEITLDLSKGALSHSHIILSADVPGISAEQFEAAVADAEKNCPISRSLNVTISVSATLV